MAAVIEQKQLVQGGAFLIDDLTPQEISTPEDFNEEHRMIAETTRQFVDNEVVPHIDALEKHDWKLARELVKKAADLGLIGANIPEEYGGLGLDQISGALIGENVGRSASFATTLGAESGIGLLPIVYFGTEAAKQNYLPKLASGELITAYALTEAGAGSDAMAGKASARLTEDGKHYVINGEKMWITNGGFADIFVVFAKVDGDKFSAFIIERQPGLSSGAEEHKMGIKGSSTTALVLSDVKTPVENLLGEVGKGHKIAFNILNIGRFKLGAMCIGGMKLMAHESVRYANERHQFDKPISSFGAIKAKLAEQCIRTWVGEAMVYRTLGMIEAGISAIADSKDMDARLKAIEEYAAECSIIKVALSEYCDFVADEMVQIYGGYGYSADYPAERAYRDSRINRIFEGTNEINRLLVPGRLMKSAMSGKLALLPAAQALMDEILSPQLSMPEDDEEALAAEQKLVKNAKKVALMTLGTAAQKYMMKLADQQEILMGVADIIIDTYAMESAILRTQKLAGSQGAAAERYVDMTRVFCNDAVERIDANARNTLAAMAEGDELRTLLVALRRFMKHTPMNAVAARQRIADVVIQANKYVY